MPSRRRIISRSDGGTHNMEGTVIQWGKDWSVIHDKLWKCLEKAKNVKNKEVQDLSLKCSAWKGFINFAAKKNF